MASNPIKIGFKKTSEPDVTQVKNVWVKKWITWVKNVENWLYSLNNLGSITQEPALT